jgi:hypothetical protein
MAVWRGYLLKEKTMKNVTIKLREEHEGHPEDQKMYAVMHKVAGEYAMTLRSTGEYTDDQLVAISTRAMQQLAANATMISTEMSLDIEVAHE